MPAEKTVSACIGVSPRFKALLEVAAGHEHRSLTSMLETLLYSPYEQRGLNEPAAGTGKANGAKK